MHLSDYMSKNDLRDEDVADAIGKSRVSVSRWRRKLVRPDWASIEVIRVWSRNQVMADDWRELAPEAEEPRAAAGAAS